MEIKMVMNFFITGAPPVYKNYRKTSYFWNAFLSHCHRFDCLSEDTAWPDRLNTQEWPGDLVKEIRLATKTKTKTKNQVNAQQPIFSNPTPLTDRI